MRRSNFSYDVRTAVFITLARLGEAWGPQRLLLQLRQDKHLRPRAPSVMWASVPPNLTTTCPSMTTISISTTSPRLFTQRLLVLPIIRPPPCLLLPPLTKSPLPRICPPRRQRRYQLLLRVLLRLLSRRRNPSLKLKHPRRRRSLNPSLLLVRSFSCRLVQRWTRFLLLLWDSIPPIPPKR